MIKSNEIAITPLNEFNDASFAQINSATKYLNRILAAKETNLINAIINRSWDDIETGLHWYGKNVNDSILNSFYQTVLQKEDLPKVKIFLQYETIRKQSDKFYEHLFSFLTDIDYLNALQIYHPLHASKLVLKHYDICNFANLDNDLLRQALIERFNLQPDIHTIEYCIKNNNLSYFIETSKTPLVSNYFSLNKKAPYDILLTSLEQNSFDIFYYTYNTFKPELPHDFFQLILKSGKNDIMVSKKITNQKIEHFQQFCDSFTFTPEICSQLVEGLLKSQKYDNINYFLTTICHDQDLLAATKSGCAKFPNDPFKIHLLSYIDKCSLYSSLNNSLDNVIDNNIKKMKI